MAIVWWKNLEGSPWVRRRKLTLKQWIGKEPKLQAEVDVPMITIGDWSLVDDMLETGDVLYAVGICDDIVFEKRILKRYQCELYAFDPTPYSVNWLAKQNLPDNFHCYPWAASGEDGQFMLYPRIDKHGKASKVMFTFHSEALERDDGVCVDAYRPDTMMRKLGHNELALLKMDVEGAEFGVLDALVQSEVRPKMILVEFHHRYHADGKQVTEKAVRDLRSCGYKIASISITGREFCFVSEQVLIEQGLI